MKHPDALVNRPDFDSRKVNKLLKNFINPRQYKTLIDYANNSEECKFFADKTMELFNLISDMPKTYGTEGVELKDKKVVLHYFKGDSDAWIVEKDMGDGISDEIQYQAWGLMRLNGWEPETGYISIQELIENGFELDFHWTEKTLGEIESKS
jgi:hypothetical protein